MSLFKPRRPKPPPAAAAAANPGGWVYDIDPDWVDDPNGYVPPEAIRGGWRVNDAGKFTGEFVPNAKHGPPRDELSALTEPDHWLGWLGDNPGRTVRDLLEQEFAAQVTGAELEWLKITAEPEFRTGGKRSEDDPELLRVVRAALAAPFAASVKLPTGTRDLVLGVYSLAIAGLDDPPNTRQRTWLDLGAEFEQISALLDERVYSLDDE